MVACSNGAKNWEVSEANALLKADVSLTFRRWPEGFGGARMLEDEEFDPPRVGVCAALLDGPEAAG